MKAGIKVITTNNNLATFVATPLLFLLANLTSAEAFDLNFSGTPTLISGTDLQVGAQYEYAGVATDIATGITIDAIVTIDGLQNTAVLASPFDNTAVFDNNFQPQLSVSTTDPLTGVPTVFGPIDIANAPTAEFSITFFNSANDVPLTLGGFSAQANDVDGDGTIIQEGVRFFGADSLTVGSGVTASSGSNARGAFQQGVSSNTNANPGIGEEPTNLVVANYTNDVETFQFDYFLTADDSAPSSAAIPRLNSLDLEAISATEVPFEFSPALGLVITGLGIGLHQFLKKEKIQKSVNAQTT